MTEQIKKTFIIALAVLFSLSTLASQTGVVAVIMTVSGLLAVGETGVIIQKYFDKKK